MSNIKKDLWALVESAEIQGLPDFDLNNAKEFLEYNEYELCFSTIVEQMYEFEIKINEPFFQLVEKMGKAIKLPINSYFFMNELIDKP